MIQAVVCRRITMAFFQTIVSDARNIFLSIECLPIYADPEDTSAFIKFLQLNKCNTVKICSSIYIGKLI